MNISVKEFQTFIKYCFDNIQSEKLRFGFFCLMAYQPS